MNDQEDPDWITFYYKDPSPGRFVEEVTRMGEEGKLTLDSEDYVSLGFLAKVIGDNPTLVREWFDRLQIFQMKRWGRLLVAASHSGSGEVLKYLEENGLSRDTFPRESVLEQEWECGETLDMLWGYFFASGDEAPVRRIVAALDLADDYGAAERFSTSEKTPEDQEAARRDAVFQAAAWSIESNCAQHPKVLEHCERIVRGELSTDEMMHLVIILSKLKPESYSVKFTDDSDSEQAGDAKRGWRGWRQWFASLLKR